MSAPSQVDLIAIVRCQAYNFKKPLDEDANGPCKMVVKEDVRLIFSEIPMMVLYSDQLLQGLSNVTKNWNDHSKVGNVFLRLLAFFKGYSQYVNVYERARDLIARLRASNTRFAAFLKEQETQPGGLVIPLENYLITPVQRMPRYVLLLKALADNTWKTHPDYNDLQLALKKASEINEQVNEMKRKRENHDKMLQIYNLLTIGKKEHWDKQLLMDQKTRVFVREGSVTESMIRGEPAKFHALLFNDLLLWTKMKKNNYEFKASNDLKNAKVELKYSPNDSSSIHLRCEGSMRVFKGETEDDTQRWYAAIKACVSPSETVLDPLAQLNAVMAAADEIKKALVKSKEEAAAMELARQRELKNQKDARRKPRGVRSTLKLTEMRFLEESEKIRNSRMSQQVTAIRMWQQEPDYADLSRFDVAENQIASMFHTFGSETFSAYHQMQQGLADLSVPQTPPEIVFLGRQGSGKTTLLSALLGYPLPLEDLKRPLYIHLVNNPKYSTQSPLIWVRKDYSLKPRISRDVEVNAPDQLAKELLRRATKDYSDVPVHMFFESCDVFNATLIDTPGLDAFQFHDEPLTPSGKSINNLTVRSLVYDIARFTHRQLVFVEECKHKELMSSVSGLATVVDPDLSRSFFAFTKFHHELRDMWHHAQLNAYLGSAPSQHGSFFLSMPSSESRASATNDAAMKKLEAQAYARDLEVMDMLQYDTHYAPQVGFHNFRKFFFNWLHKEHLKSIPPSLEAVIALKRNNEKQLTEVESKKLFTQNIKLRQIANAFTYDFVKVLPQILFGSAQIEASVYGHTLEDEQIELDVTHRDWVDYYNQPIVASDHGWSHIPYHDTKLYGSAQIIRLFSVFNAVVEELQLRHLDSEDIAAVIGQSRALQTRDYYISAALELAQNKAEKALTPLVRQLCQRAAQMINRLGSIASRFILDGDVPGGLFHNEIEIPLFAGHVRVLYEHYGEVLASECLDACTDVLDQSLIYNVQKYNLKIPSEDSPSAQAETITNLVAEMFTDISKQFVRNVTVKCFDILVARGVDEICKSVQNDISGLSETDLQKLFDVGSFQIALETEEKALKGFSAKVNKTQETLNKAVSEFSKQQQHPAKLEHSFSYKKLPFDPSLLLPKVDKKPKATAAPAKDDRKKTTISIPSSPSNGETSPRIPSARSSQKSPSATADKTQPKTSQEPKVDAKPANKQPEDSKQDVPVISVSAEPNVSVTKAQSKTTDTKSEKKTTSTEAKPEKAATEAKLTEAKPEKKSPPVESKPEKEAKPAEAKSEKKSPTVESKLEKVSTEAKPEKKISTESKP